MNIKQFLLGLFVGIGFVLLAGAATPNNEIGRYQIAGAGTTKSIFILDTKTGSVVNVWIKRDMATDENYMSSSDIQELLNKK